jgi:hypothetical protein
VAVLDAYPVSPGHTLIVSRRHVVSFFDLTAPEVFAIQELLFVAVHESRITNVQSGTEWRAYFPATSVDVSDAPNTATQTQLGVPDRSAQGPRRRGPSRFIRKAVDGSRDEPGQFASVR